MIGARAIAALVLSLSSASTFADCNLERGPTHSVVRLVDAETLDLDDGRQVRLAGVLVPRAEDVGATGPWPPETEARVALAARVVGKSVTLRYDAQREDRYGRRVAYLDVADGAPSVQLALLAAGHARVEAQIRHRACLDDLLAAEADARARGLGLWREAAYRVRSTRPVRDLDTSAATFQIVTGTVRDVVLLQGAWLIRLGPDRRRDLTLRIRASDRDTLGRVGGDPKLLSGASIEARGWLAARRTGGLEIDLSSAGHIRRTTGASPRPRR